MKRLQLLASTAMFGLALTGCVSLGMSQAQSEQAYTIGAGLTDTAIVLGKLTPENVGTACTVDGLNYNTLISTRNVADGVNYAAADNAHAKLQTDGSKYSPACAPPAKP